MTERPVPEAESADYGACRAELDGKRLVLRVAKTTPTKTGQFVTVWKRPHPDAEIAPLDDTDLVDVVIIAVSDGAQQGFFIFPRSVLIERGLMSRSGAGGKRALRVYPPWCVPESGQALRTQRWQGAGFVAEGDQLGLARLLEI
ncbi:MepB family protein [Janthinobacterium sp. SUN118]|uniref:MepB family protein n=1 Tax=Janthinobacterium sp. SUN118 TaxID=3004100 RepID=UPI0025B00F8D|nr:MepB family protein [Janthinobacterium sp. SUN118]MDN2710622.1 MepB family protein [Janthinobacterium sp. SUN118]